MTGHRDSSLMSIVFSHLGKVSIHLFFNLPHLLWLSVTKALTETFANTVVAAESMRRIVQDFFFTFRKKLRPKIGGDIVRIKIQFCALSVLTITFDENQKHLRSDAGWKRVSNCSVECIIK